MHRQLAIKYIDNDDPRKNVDYIETIEQLKNFNKINGIIIPEKSDEFSDYNYEYMIDQIRTDTDQKIARLPILMKFDKIEELYESSLDEEEWAVNKDEIKILVKEAEEYLEKLEETI